MLIHVLEPHHAEDFTRISLAWLDKYGLTEPGDLQEIEKICTEWPKEYTLWGASMDGKVVGVIGLYQGESANEVIKLGVDEGYQGMGIGRKLIQTLMDEVERRGLREVILYSNSQLVAALEAYRKFGFEEVSVDASIALKYHTADVKMRWQNK